jgi:hypothetical protein
MSVLISLTLAKEYFYDLVKYTRSLLFLIPISLLGKIH